MFSFGANAELVYAHSVILVIQAIWLVRYLGLWRYIHHAIGGEYRQRKLPFQIMYVSCLSCPIATFALQSDGFVPREWLATKSLLT